MGLKSSTDIFQATMDKHLKGLLGIICIADDIILHGKREQEHNDCMYALFNRLPKIICELNGKVWSPAVQSLKLSSFETG